MDIKGYVEQATAKLQGEVGRFLILKEAIMKLPEGQTRDGLLNTQNNLEGKALNLIGRAQAFKEAASFKGVDILKMFDPGRIADLKKLAGESANTISEIQDHKAKVARATGEKIEETAKFTVPPIVKLAFAVGAVAYASAWVKRESRRRWR